LPTLVSDVNSGVSGQKVLTDTARNALLGGLFGSAYQTLADILPQMGTLEYQKLIDSGVPEGLAAKLADFAKLLNPNAVDDASAGMDEEQHGLGNDNNDGYNEISGNAPIKTIRVGRWMSQKEYDVMCKTGLVQESTTGTTYIAWPNEMKSFGNQAKPGTIYVEFNVPANSIKMTSLENGWAKILGPNSLESRLAVKNGFSPFEMPVATDIQIIGRK
jgi:hypothetical protein